jgi:hypothetical protein
MTTALDKRGDTGVLLIWDPSLSTIGPLLRLTFPPNLSLSITPVA